MWTPEQWYQTSFEQATRSAEHIREMAAWTLRVLGKRMEATPEQVGEIVGKVNRERLDAVPDLARYPELRGMRELMDARWRGVRDGAKLSEAEWAVHCGGNFYQHRYLDRDLKPADTQAGTGRCSYVYFPTSDRGPVLGNNLDSSPEEPFGGPGWPMLNEHLIWGGVSAGVFMDELSPEIFPAPVNELVAANCRSTAEAAEMFERYNHFWGPGNGLLIDRDHNVAMVEKSACRIGVRHSPDGFGFITAMTAEHPEMQAFRADRRQASLDARGLGEDSADAIYWAEADHRRQLMADLVDEARKAPTVDGLRAIMQHRSERGRVCYVGEPVMPGGPPVEHTLKTTVWVLGERKAMWWAKDGDTPSFENQQPDVDLPADRSWG